METSVDSAKLSQQDFFRTRGESWSLIRRWEHPGSARPCARPGTGWELCGHSRRAPRQPPAGTGSSRLTIQPGTLFSSGWFTQDDEYTAAYFSVDLACSGGNNSPDSLLFSCPPSCLSDGENPSFLAFFPGGAGVADTRGRMSPVADGGPS